MVAAPPLRALDETHATQVGGLLPSVDFRLGQGRNHILISEEPTNGMPREYVNGSTPSSAHINTPKCNKVTKIQSNAFLLCYLQLSHWWWGLESNRSESSHTPASFVSAQSHRWLLYCRSGVRRHSSGETGKDCLSSSAMHWRNPHAMLQGPAPWGSRVSCCLQHPQPTRLPV